MPNYQALNSQQHQNLKIIVDGSYSHAANSHVVPLSVFELTQAQADYPIVLIKDSQTGQFHLVALVGLKPNENLFNKAGSWQAEYIPLQLQGHPLALTQAAENNDKQIVAIDLDAASVSERQGTELFTADGRQSALLADKIDLMSKFNAQVSATQHFTTLLVSNELVSPQALTVKTNQGEEVNLTGLYIVDENKLNALSSDAFDALKKENLLAPIYACIFSLQRISRLISLT